MPECMSKAEKAIIAQEAFQQAKRDARSKDVERLRDISAVAAAQARLNQC